MLDCRMGKNGKSELGHYIEDFLDSAYIHPQTTQAMLQFGPEAVCNVSHSQYLLLGVLSWPVLGD